MYRVLTGLGYFLGLEKCISVSSPATRLQYLGMLIDTNEQAFIVPQDKHPRFAELREFILGCKTSVSLKSIQKMMGKCNFFSLAFPGTKPGKDASSYRWAVIFHFPPRKQEIGDCWEEDIR